jgi:hypothetical protein
MRQRPQAAAAVHGWTFSALLLLLLLLLLR